MSLIKFLNEIAVYLSYSGIGVLLIGLSDLFAEKDKRIGILSKVIGSMLLILGLFLFVMKIVDKIYIFIFH
ncbi:hypothetical protein [Desulforamulus ferrireducens]|uniref:Uncharacterized protein n=1 Tax=Desulforamulus ferrireducens TaxID=1833852 RepID=A0A1S6ISD0_9FIRM|nr:hypothetical protein [Desulforamulus ferrireducens]AQS57683.1 hypothetical protein B0537_00195 [Desulforamulus ferrireducens]